MSPNSLHLILLASAVVAPLIVALCSVMTGDAAVAATALLIAALSGCLALWVSTRLKRGFAEIIQGVDRFAVGDLSFRLSGHGCDEIDQLSSALNRVARQVEVRIREERHQRSELDAVLSSMSEGVLVVDRRENVSRMNQAARKMAGWEHAAPEGRGIQEIFRNTALQNFIRGALKDPRALPGEVEIVAADESVLRAYAKPLEEGSGAPLEILVVLQDVSRLVRLERMRRDFVANVSHELKTPITSIKGFVETLLDGSIDNPTESRRFLEIILRHTDRLNGIFDDLLSLSRIERQNESGTVTLEPHTLLPVIQSAQEVCKPRAQQKSIEITVNCPESLEVLLDPSLLEQALSNLIDNAIKFSPEGTPIEISTDRHDNWVEISVTDRGCGIDKSHHPRLFERFYRVDQARSRSMGGTGLGLAIVKHICEAHGGRIEVRSKLGAGSTFSIFLQAATPRSNSTNTVA